MKLMEALHVILDSRQLSGHLTQIVTMTPNTVFMDTSSGETEQRTQSQNLSAPLIHPLHARACTCTALGQLAAETATSLSDCAETLEAYIIDVVVNKGLWWPRGTAG